MNIGMELDGIITNLELYLRDKGKTFFKEKYNKDIVNYGGYSIKEIFGCSNEEENEFLKKYLFKYAITTKPRNGIAELNKNLKNGGFNIVIFVSRKFSNDNTKIGSLMRFIIKEWLELHNIEYDNLVFCSNDKIKDIKENNIDIMIEDNPEIIQKLKGVSKVICMNSVYNQNICDNKRVFSLNNETLERIIELKNKILQEEVEKRENNENRVIYGKASVDRPWMKYYSIEERKVELPKMKIYDYLLLNNKQNLNRYALNYFNNKITFNEMFNKIDKFAKAFQASGIKENDIVSLCLPNVPEAVYAFYALNKIGAVANMIHPLKSSNEIKDILNNAKSEFLIFIDNAYESIDKIINDTYVKKAIAVSAGDSMPLGLKLLYKHSNNIEINYGNKYEKISDYLKLSNDISSVNEVNYQKDKTAVIIYTGGSTGTPKGVMLTNDNFNCMVHQQKATAENFGPGDKMLTIMPVFHGFGLCSSVHMPLSYGITTILIPKFESKEFYKLIKKYQPNHIFGVPKLLGVLMKDEKIQHMNLSFMRYIVSGGENMKSVFETEFNKFLLEHGCSSKLKKGYGLSEAVAGTTLSDDACNDIGSAGIPLICNDFKIVKPNTEIELDYNNEGELCISGPTVMKGYLNNVEETNKALRKHSDGKIWLHTGDMGYLNEDGKFYYTDRLTRMYISAGFNVYPPRIEKIIESLDGIESCAVVPKKHPYKEILVPKAYIIMKDNYVLTDELKNKILKICKDNLDSHHQPFEIVEIDEFPLTNLGNDIGKIDYKQLENYDEKIIKQKIKK